MSLLSLFSSRFASSDTSTQSPAIADSSPVEHAQTHSSSVASQPLAPLSAESTGTTVAMEPMASIEHSEADIALRRQIRAAWKLAAQAKTTTAAQLAAYTLLMGKSLDKAFTPITNVNKLSNGHSAHGARDAAVWKISRLHCDAFAPWASLLTEVSKDRGGYAFATADASPLLTRAQQAAIAFRDAS